MARILDVEGFATLIERNVRYAAPELRPIGITDDDEDLRPTFQSDIFSLGILLLQVCPYLRFSSVNHSTIYSCFMGQMRIYREGYHTTMSVTVQRTMITRCYDAFTKGTGHSDSDIIS